MNVFGHKWGNADAVERNYKDGRLGTLKIKVHSPDDVENLIVYKCDLCTEFFRHWLCADQAWRSLPSCVQGKVICPHCFVAVRRLKKLERA